MTGCFRLSIELVPRSCFYENLRKLLPKSEWDRLRKKVYAQYDYRCEICKAEGRLNCHEVWYYDEAREVQKLVGFVALCSLCHHVKHLRFAMLLAESGRLDLERVILHFMRVNNCTRFDFEEHRRQAFQQWEERSQHLWQVDIEYYQAWSAGKI